jgi:Tol biopolymer transport system component
LCLDLETYQLGSHTAFEAYFSQGCFPSWSPDGTRLVLAEKDDPTSTPSRLVIVDADGNPLASLLGEARISGLSFPAWSPDGSHIAFTRTGLGNTCAIYIVEVPSRILP